MSNPFDDPKPDGAPLLLQHNTSPQQSYGELFDPSHNSEPAFKSTSIDTTAPSGNFNFVESSPDSFDNPQPLPPPPAPAPEEKKSSPFYSFDYWTFLFNVDSPEVGLRIFKSLVPYPPNFLDTVKNNPDVYGPFWIASTLVFILAAAGNVAGFLNSWKHGSSETWVYNLDKLGVAAGTIYGYLAVVPVALFALCKYLKIELQYLQLLCIYGYSLFVYLPVSIICMAPFVWIRWVFVGLACLVSTTLLVANFWVQLRDHRKVGFIILAIMIGLNVAFAFGCALYFFLYS